MRDESRSNREAKFTHLIIAVQITTHYILLNYYYSTIKFTPKKSEIEVPFLDTIVYKGDSNESILDK